MFNKKILVFCALFALSGFALAESNLSTDLQKESTEASYKWCKTRDAIKIEPIGAPVWPAPEVYLIKKAYPKIVEICTALNILRKRAVF